MPVSIKGTGGGGVTLDAGAAASATTLTLPNTTGTVALTASPTFSGTLTATTITSPAATALTVQSAGTTAMTIDTSQNVGIGTTSPAQKLQIVSNSGGYAFQITGSVNDYYGMSLYNTSGGANARSYLQFGNDADQYQAFISLNSSGNAAQGGAKSLNIFQGTNAPITFSINGGEVSRFDSSGNLLVGTTSQINSTDSARLNLLLNSSLENAIVARSTATSAGKYWRIGYINSSNTWHLLNQSGSGVYITDGATSWTGTSDERMKTDLKPIEDATNKVATLRAVTGRFKTDEEGTSRSFLIAQDVQKVLPEAVSVQSDEQGTLGLAYTDVIPLLVAAIKELSAKNDALEARLAALEAASVAPKN